MKFKLFQKVTLATIPLVLLLASTNSQANNDVNHIPDSDPYRIIVKMKQPLMKGKVRNMMREKAKVSALASTMGVNIKRAQAIGGDAYVITLDKQAVDLKSRQKRSIAGQEVDDMIADLNKQYNVEYAVKDMKAYAFAIDMEKQPNLVTPPRGIDAQYAWQFTMGDPDVVVAVVDTGLAYPNHKDLQKNYLPGLNILDGTSRAFDYKSFHGTHVAGIIAADGEISGVAPGVKHLPVKVLSDDGEGYFSDVIKGMYWAAGFPIPYLEKNDYPADVINLSLGGGPALCDKAMQDAIDNITMLGVTVVAAAGNEDSNVAAFIPANCLGVITVASSNEHGLRSFYSNYGFKGAITVSAPGGDKSLLGDEGGILSTVDNDSYAYYQGTSMASPHVAGIVALIYSSIDKDIIDEPMAYPLIARFALEETAYPFPSKAGEYSCQGFYNCGTGIANAYGALMFVHKLNAVWNELMEDDDDEQEMKRKMATIL